MDVRSAMSPNPAACSADTPLHEVAKLMRDNDCGQIPVIDAAGHPVGVVTDRDIVVRLLADGRDPNAACASDCMSTPAMTIEASRTLADACDLMEAQRVRRLPVVDADGRLCGMVAQADIALHGRDRETLEVVKQVSEPAHH